MSGRGSLKLKLPLASNDFFSFPGRGPFPPRDTFMTHVILVARVLVGPLKSFYALARNDGTPLLGYVAVLLPLFNVSIQHRQLNFLFIRPAMLSD